MAFKKAIDERAIVTFMVFYPFTSVAKTSPTKLEKNDPIGIQTLDFVVTTNLEDAGSNPTKKQFKKLSQSGFEPVNSR